MTDSDTANTARGPWPDEHPLEGGQTDAVDDAQEDARRDPDDDETGDIDPSSTSAAAARPGGGEQ
jgi:hypothetical protein